MLKAIWFGLIDAWLSAKRMAFIGSGLWYETKPGALLVDVQHRDRRKTIRFRTEKLDAAIDYIDRQPHGAAVVFKEGDHWTLVPDFLSRDLRSYLVTARDALRRSKGDGDVSANVVSDPAVNTKPPKPTASSLN
jgi:hypothetical protein